MTTTAIATASRGRHAIKWGPDGSAGRGWRWGGAALLAVLAYVPVLAVRPGVVTPDTKTYLYLDPVRFLSQVAFMWNPTVALGTVTHEYIGYLLPMGPFYAVFHLLGVPVWVAQRLWLGSILFAAGVGILYLTRVLGLRGPGPVAAALAYMLSPYFLQYAARISVILLPWAGLPFMLAFTIVALRRGGWREPALFAIVVALVSGINASSVIYVAVAPILWLLYAVVVLRESTWRHALGTGLRILVLTLGACLWWIAGLEVEAAYGVNVLKYTETVSSTSQTSNPADILRGLGYWYFYGSDHLGSWTSAAVRFTQDVALLVTSYAVPVLALVSAAFVRWRERSYFLLLLFVGMVLSVGPFPFTNPTRIGGVLKEFMTNTTAGLALRSTDRATPVVLLALAMLLGSGLTALWRRLSVVGVTTALLVAGLVVANNPSLFNGDAIVGNSLEQPSSLPSYQLAAISHLNATHPGTRVFAIPGNDFASYRWGNTVDTPQPALLNRSFVTREQQIMGSIATADTLYAVDGPIQDGIADTNALAPMARLMGAGDLMVEYDQRYEHYGLPHPQLLAEQLSQTPLGLTDPISFGSPRPNVSTYSTLNEQDLAAPADLSWPSPIVDYTVPNPRPLLRAESDTGAVVTEGDATGLDNLAGLGLLNTDSAIYYAGTLAGDPSQLRQLASQGAHLALTDTNRKQAFQWASMTANSGYTETPSDNPAKTDPKDSPIELFPDAGLSSKTVASYVGAVNVTASSYGNDITYNPEYAAYSAIDDNPDTAWITGTFVPDPAGQWWQAQFANSVTTNHITLVQPQRGDRSRWVSSVTLTFDGKDPVRFQLTDASHAATGQTLTFPTRTFHTLRVTIDGTTNNHVSFRSASAVGFSEVEIPGQTVRQLIDMPTQMLSTLGAASQSDRLTVVMTRERESQYPPRDDPETTISRQFTLPTTRTFTLTGSASMSALIPDDEIDALVGRSASAATGVIDAYSSGRLPGDLQATASTTLDGNPTTGWQPGLGIAAQDGATLTYNLAGTNTFTQLNLQIIADGRHSVPTTMTIASGSQVRHIALPAIADSTVPDATTTVPVSFPAISGSHFVITFNSVRAESAGNYYSIGTLALPLGIAEIGFPGVKSAPTPAQLPGDCVGNLLSIDGRPIDVETVGSTQQALNGSEVQVVPCGPDADGITLSAGTHVVETAAGHNTTCASEPQTCTGWNLDQLVLDSVAGGGAGPAVTPTAAGTPELPATQPRPAPRVTQTSSHVDTQTADVTGATQPFELVLGESVNKGWRAVAQPAPGAPAGSHAVDLGTSQLIDGFANGWHVTAADLGALGGKNFTVALTWTPQKEVWAALTVSAATLVLCLLLAFLPARSRRWLRAHLPRQLRGPAGPDAPVWPAAPFDSPTLTLPFLRDPPVRPFVGRPTVLRALFIGVVTAGVASLVLTGAAALAVGAVVAVGLLVPWARVVATVGALAFIVAGTLNVIRGQQVHRYLPGSNWAGSFMHAGNLVWIGVALLLADAVITAFGLRTRKPLRRGAVRAGGAGGSCGDGG
ncbi:MAG TPA: alpha-(1-_3)-arabinofuranosyltransferase family protein, partial [Acidimicrobiales bacterium]